MVKSNNKILSLALALILVVNVFAGVTLSSDAATPWVWEPYSTGYCAANNVTGTDNAAGGYTTFTVNGDDPYLYPGLGAGSLAHTAALGKIDADTLKYGIVRYRTNTAAPGSILANGGSPTVSLGTYNGTGEWTDIKLDLSSTSGWTGSIDWFRYDPFDGNVGSVDLAFIAFFTTAAERDTYASNRAMPKEYVYTDVNLYGPYLETINSSGTYQLDGLLDDGVFGDTWTDAGFPDGSTVVPFGYNNFVYIGDYNFANVEKIIIKCNFSGNLNTACTTNSGCVYSYGLSKTAASFGWADVNHPANYENAIAYTTIPNITGAAWNVGKSYEITDIDNSYSGPVWLTGYICNGTVSAVTGLTLVSSESEKYEVSVGTISNGTVTATPTGSVDIGTEVTVTATPDTGYELDEILVNGTAITGTKFTVTSDSVITATFKKIQYAVSVGTVSNGTVTINPTGTVNNGTLVTVTATPDTGYELDEILVNGSAITGNTFTVTGASVVTATFTEIIYDITVGTVENGRVTLNGEYSAVGGAFGATIYVTATPDAGYQLDEILVNGTPITGSTFTVAETAVVTATFSLIPVSATTYEVSVGTVENGTVTASPLGTVEEGRTITVTATPDAGYQLDEILVNGTAISGNTFELTENSVITATFSLIPVVKYDVSVGTVENGTVTVAPNGEVEEGTTITVTATPAEGYTLDQILVNGSAITGTTFEVTADSVVTATFKSNIVSVGNILIDTMNENIWATPYKTIIFDDTYAGPYRGPWQYTLVCRYNSVLGKYVVEEKYVPAAGSNTSFALAANQIIINAVGDSESYKACSAVWTATQVGSVLTLSGVDLVNKTVAAGAYAAVENGVTIPDDPNKGTEYEGNKISEFMVCIDSIDADSDLTPGIGGSDSAYQAGTLDVSSSLGIVGWAATANGIDHYEYSLDRLNFTKIEDAVIAERPDLTAADVAYASGHDTAGFNLKIPASAFGEDGTYGLTVRAVDKQGNYFDIMTAVVNADVPENLDGGNNGNNNNGNNNNNNNNNNNDYGSNVETDDSAALTIVGLMAIVAMAAVVLKRRKEY